MEQQKRIDASSGLFPQAMLETLLAHEVARSRRYPSPISLLYFALRFPRDPSPEIVESAQILIANHLHAAMREADLPGLFEGNYLVIMPSTESDGARMAAQRMLENFPRSQITRTAELFQMSMCIGVASHKGGPDISAAQLLSNASTALWEAQKRGPKSLVVYGEIVKKTV
ncbi:MAG: diguanylate cyclase [Anaerolineales bacterium]|jgi:GGDEF domain-containing protein